MESPYSPPISSGDAISRADLPRRLPGLLSWSLALLLSLAFVYVGIHTLVALLRIGYWHTSSDNPLVTLLSHSILMVLLVGLIGFFWRLGKHFLYPATHSFYIRHRENARALLNRHRDLDLSAVALPDSMYHSLTLMQLLGVYRLMDRRSHPDRLAALLATMQSHPDLKREQSSPVSTLS